MKKAGNFKHPLSRTLFSTQQKSDIHRTFSLVCRVKNGNIGYSSLVLYSARDKNVTYIVDFLGFKSEISQV